MNCERIRESIELALTAGSSPSGSEVESHLRDCPACSAYLSDLRQLQAALNAQVFEVQPGELDDLTFERLAETALSHRRRKVSPRSALAGFGRWAWAPVAAAVIAVIMFFIPKNGVVIDDQFESGPGMATGMNFDVFETGVPDSAIWSEVVDRFLENGAEFDALAEEVPVDFDTALENMSEEELRLLYEKIELLNGRVS